MITLLKSNLFRVLTGIGMAAVLIIAAHADGSSVNIAANGISATATVADVASMELRIGGPGDFYTAQRSESDYINWNAPYGLADGEYRYEVFVTVGTAPKEGKSDQTQLYRENGRFKIESGILSPIVDDMPLSPLDEQAAANPFSWMTKLVNAIVDLIVPSAEAADLIASSATPYIYFDDTSTSNGTQWGLRGDDAYFYIYNYDGSADISYYPFWTEDSTPFQLYLGDNHFRLYNFLSDTYQIYVDSAAGADVLRANSAGDIELADGAVFIFKSFNRLGIGTITPTQELHVVSTGPDLLLDDTVGGDLLLSNNNGEGGFQITNGNFNGYILHFENDLTSLLYPGVGIWEVDPEAALHVSSYDNMSAGLLVENSVAPTAAGDVQMFNLRNAGPKIVRFGIQAGGADTIWTFDNDPNYNAAAGVNRGQFRIAKSGTGVAEFTVDGYGTGRFYGNSYAVNHINTSSRETKTDFQALDERDVLAKLMQLEVSAWRYKQEGKDARHIGPVAEDFQQVFGLGDGKHISTVDSEGIALAAIKAIKAEKDAEIEALKVENASLAVRLKALEALVLPKDIAMND